ncbi:ciliogenesis and planar polarity effector 1 [Alosa pseudoharengus]|uniref:ciliogenesis and planar polarity effector 1 n=1 Tax=Alosa pseudoharengus TaxID=34774 RepID=UPI003F8AA9AD
MELKLEVVLSSSIKGKKPWPRFCWLGMEKENVFLLDDNRINEVNLVTGRTKKKNPKLQSVLPSVVLMTTSPNGMWLAGVLTSGDLFLWSKDTDLFKTSAPVPDVIHQLTAVKENGVPLILQVSGDGHRVLLLALSGQVLLWECTSPLELSAVRGATVSGRWSQVHAPSNAAFPSIADKEAICHSLFIQSQVLGDVCLIAFVFCVGEQLSITFLKLQWDEGVDRKLSPVGYDVLWVTKTYPLGQLATPCCPVKSRGALVSSLSPDGLLLAIIINQKDPRTTQALFVSTQNFVSVSAGLGGCGSKNLSIPAKYVRSYWVASVCWSPGGLFLACVLKRGSLLMLMRLGGLLTLSTTGCDIDFGPAHFLPLHPLVTYRPPAPVGADGSLSSSSASLRDVFRQRYSVTWHPRLPFLILSDGYMATLLRAPGLPEPSALISSLLLDSAGQLERARALLLQTQPQAQLECLSSLKFTASLQALKDRETSVPSLPLCLQDDGTTDDLQEAYERAQAEAEDECTIDGQSSGLRREDGGSLEFASMFDTLHAQPDLLQGSQRPSAASLPLRLELDGAQRGLLTAWALVVSLGGRVEQRPRLLRYAVRCAARLALLLRLGDGQANRKKGRRTWVSRVLHLFRALLSFVPWDGPRVSGASAVSTLVELSRSFVQLLLSPGPGLPLSSHSLAAATGLLRLAACCMDDAYSPSLRSLSQSEYRTPMLQEQVTATDPESVQVCPQRPSARLGCVWQGLYKQTLQYQSLLRSQTDHQGSGREHKKVSATLCLIQGELQRAGVSLAEDPELHCLAGEELFLQGAYTQSTETWRAELWPEQEIATLTPRSCYLQTRYGLALLYSLLYQYRLREAQSLGDHMARRLLQEPGHNKEPEEECVCGSWPPVQVHREVACAIVQSLGRFMAAYFANQTLAVRPPHCVDVLDPLHFDQATGPRVVALSQQSVAAAVRSQHLSEQWTVGYALELLLIGGLLPEAVWLTSRLGDWTTAAALSLAYSNYCTENALLSRLRWKELHLPPELQPGSIFQAQLEALLGPAATEASQGRDSHRTPSVEEGDEEQLLLCVQELLKASVMARLDVLSRPIGQLLAVAKEMSSELVALVPAGLYLPAPPLYCPQPAPSAQERSGDVGLHAERACRLRVSAVVRKALLLLRAARCALPAAQWYVARLQRCRKNYRKIRKCPVPAEALLPEGLRRFLSHSGFFKPGAARDGPMDPVIVQTLTCFRELCGLLWMLHVRDQLTTSCRKYQAARNHGRDAEKGSYADSGLCEDALRWVCRLLPFSRFLCAEELLQDLLLSLLAQLPPTAMVAEVLVWAFPEEEQSVRVALREKYSTLLQTLRPCPVVPSTNTQDGQTDASWEREESMEQQQPLMSALLKKSRKRRARLLSSVAKHMAWVQLHLWEREEGGDERADFLSAGPDRFSLGASRSLSSLTETTAATLTSNTDANASQPLSPDLLAGSRHSTLKLKVQDRSGEAIKQNQASCQETDAGTLPVVGSWEFELEDEEYVRFLELFLSYLLDRGSGGSQEAELPLIGCFWAGLRERELHSLGFDVLTTLKRRQRDMRKGSAVRSHARGDAPRPPVFWAGRCFHAQRTDPEPERPPSSASRPSLLVQPGPPSPGLWSGKQQVGVTLDLSPSPSMAKTFPSTPSLEVQQELDPDLEARFPALGRLLEWMSRWADRRVLLRRMEEQRGAGGPAIRAKASAPAVLTALLLLERRYSAALLAADKSHMRIPEVELTVSPVLQFPSCSGEQQRETAEEEAEERQRGRERERESSVDTGYPGSVGTPITLPDVDLQPPQASEAFELLELQSESEASNLDSVASDPDSIETAPKPPPTQGSNMADAYLFEEHNSAEELAHPSAQIPSPMTTAQSGPLGQGLTLADLEGTESSGSPTAVSDTEEDRLSDHGPPEADSKTEDIPIGEAVGPVPPQQAELPLTEAHSAPGSRQPPAGTHSRMHDTHAAPDNTNPVTQLVQDELFRLVQLQQINFMSLMQVVGASFANLPFSQARLPLPQSVPLPQSNPPFTFPSAPQPHPSPLPSHPNTAQTLPATQPPHAPLPQTNGHPTQPPGSQLAAPPSHVSPDPQGPLSAAQQQRAPERQQAFPGPPLCAPQPQPRQDDQQYPHSTQSMQPLTITSGPGRSRPPESIPAFQGLLTTVGASVTPTLPSGGSTQNTPSLIPLERTRPEGLRLLQLPPPQPGLLRPPLPSPVREAWAPQLPNAHPPPPLHPPPLPHPSAHRWPERTAWAPEVSRRDQGAPRLLPVPQHAAPSRGLPLLHLRPSSCLPVSLPLIPQPAPAPAPASLLNPAGMGPFPRLQLLQRGPDPPSTGRHSEPPLRTPRLIPLEALMSWAAGGAQGPQMTTPLLKASMPAPSHTHVHSPSQPVLSSTPSTHRQRRRMEKERTVEVSFRPEDSIIPPAEPEIEVPVSGDGFVLPLGSCDSVLSGQRLLQASIATAAELHAFASTQKRPPELQDACTNTESVPQLRPDKSTSAQRSPPTSAAPQPERGLGDAAPCLPPELFLDLRFPKEDGSPHISVPAQDAEGRRFINVIDLEDEALLQDLPQRQPPVPITTTTTAPSSPPTSAQLHLLAASVTNATHTPLLPASEQESDELLGYTRGWKPEEDRSSLQAARPAPSDPSERLPAPAARQEPPPPAVLAAVDEFRGDALTRSLLDKPLWSTSQLDRSQASPSQVSVRQVSARLSEMDKQLAALQSIADQMDQEFADTRLLVRTIDHLSPGFLTHAEEKPHSSPPAVTKAVKSLVRDARPALELTDVLEEDEDILSSSPAAIRLPATRRRQSPLSSHPVSSRTSILQQHTSYPAAMEQRMWETSQDVTIGDQSGSRRTEDTLGLSGLSDVADILGELVRDGGLSPTALGLSHTQAARFSRAVPSHVPQQPPRGQRSEEERRELRAWMRRKQRERLVEYRRQREERRAHERRPFTSTASLKPNSRDVSLNRKIKEEKDKIALLEHHTQRASEAYSLMSDLLTTPLPVPTVKPRSKSTSPASAKITIRSRSQSAGRMTKSPGLTRSLSSPGRTVVLPRRRVGTSPHESLSSRLGLHRPASALPGDRLSQVTRRGMLTYTRGRSAGFLKETQRRPLSQSPTRHKTERPGRSEEQRGRKQKREEEVEERELLSPWEPPLEIRRILGLDLQDNEQGARGTEGDLDALETLSESTGSILAKINWEDIEKLVAEVEEDDD